jgi:hypothetical protein
MYYDNYLNKKNGNNNYNPQISNYSYVKASSSPPPNSNILFNPNKNIANRSSNNISTEQSS